MYKATLELFNVNEYMKVKYGLVLKGNDEDKIKNIRKSDIITSFSINGNNFLNIKPIGFLTLDISKMSDRKDAWNSNLQINFGRYSFYELKRKVKTMLDCFQVKELYYIKYNQLTVDKTLSEKYRQVINTTSGKSCMMVHVVVPDKENQEILDEGIVFMIQSIDNYCYLRYNELQYLYDELCNINFDVLNNTILLTELLTNRSIAPEETPQYETETNGFTEKETKDRTEISTAIMKPNILPDI